ncbi:MAG: hypothetical protein KDA95_11135, partial [Acidimicrobiales bacterium]|nr:hypothetical protein [Acidimicrobiales bacterium]
MSTWLYGIGLWTAQHRRSVVAAWLAAAIVLVGLNHVVGASNVDNFRVPGAQSQAATDLLKARFPERSGATAMVVFHVSSGSLTDPGHAEVVARTIEAL